jgi:hypothetical protein
VKIVWMDNFNRDTVSEQLVCSGIRSAAEGEVMLAALQARCTDGGPDWYKLEGDDYELYVFDPT